MKLLFPFVFLPACLLASVQAQVSSSLGALPDAPHPALPGVVASVQAGQQPASPASAQTTAPASSGAQSQRDQAEQQLKQQEHQRILGVVPNFNTTDNANAVPLTSGQKFRLMFRSVADPFEFVAAGADAGISQAEDDFPGYGQGAQGYGKRFGASYADTFDGSFWGNAVFPSLLHQDPRYFRKGSGSFTHRLFYAVSTTVWTKNDSGKWGPNYSNVAGNLVAGGISNLYYPDSDRGAGLTFERAFTVTAEGAIGAVAVEFWPDIARKVFHRSDPYSASAPSAQPR